MSKTLVDVETCYSQVEQTTLALRFVAKKTSSILPSTSSDNSDKFPYLLKPLIDFKIEGACPDKPSKKPFV